MATSLSTGWNMVLCVQYLSGCTITYMQSHSWQYNTSRLISSWSRPMLWFWLLISSLSIPMKTFRVYLRGEGGPVLLLLHGGGHSALSWAVFAVSSERLSVAEATVTVAVCVCQFVCTLVCVFISFCIVSCFYECLFVLVTLFVCLLVSVLCLVFMNVCLCQLPCLCVCLLLTYQEAVSKLVDCRIVAVDMRGHGMRYGQTIQELANGSWTRIVLGPKCSISNMSKDLGLWRLRGEEQAEMLCHFDVIAALAKYLQWNPS